MIELECYVIFFKFSAFLITYQWINFATVIIHTNKVATIIWTKYDQKKNNMQVLTDLRWYAWYPLYMNKTNILHVWHN